MALHFYLQTHTQVMFTSEKMTFRQLEINNRTGLFDKKYRICFASLKIQEAYYKLLENPCSLYVFVCGFFLFFFMQMK